MLRHFIHSGSLRRHLGILTLASSAAAISCNASAQTVEELEPVVVQGATLEVPSPKKPKAAPQGGGGQPAVPGQSEGAAGEGPAGEGPEAAPTDTVSGVPLDEIGTSVSVVTRAELRAQQIRHAADVLRSLPGVSVSQQGGAANLTVVRLRGAESNHTLVLVDGVEVNSATSGFFDFSNLTAEDIERIEVLRGPQSGLYGSSALGGVINIITTQGRGPLTVRARGEAGALATRDASVQLSGGNDSLHGALTLHRRDTDGFNIAPVGGEDDGSELTNFSFSGGARIFENLKLDGTLRRSRTRGDRDGFNGILDGFFVSDDDLSTFDTQLWIGRLAATLDTLDGRWVHRVYANKAETDAEDDDRGPFPVFSHIIDENLKFGYASTYRLDAPGDLPVRHFLTGLIERERESFIQPTVDDIERERSRNSMAAEIRGEYYDTLFLAATVRHDDNESFEDFTSWRAQASLKVPGTVLRLHGSAGTGVKYPSFAELFGTFVRFAPNPDLMPETSLGWDAGVEARLLGGRAVVDVTYFEANLEDEITEDFSNFPEIRVVNLDGESTRRGIEVAARYRLMDGLVVGGAYTYLDAQEPSGDLEVRRPRHSGRFDLNYAFLDGKANLNLAAIYNGVMEDNVFNIIDPTITRFRLDDYWLVNVAGSYRVAPGVELFGRVENALNQDYQEVFGYETAGVAAFAGVRFTYEEPASVAWAQGK